MAVYPFDMTSSTTLLGSIRDALDAAGILTTVHRDTSTNLIVTITRLTSRVVRFNVAVSRLHIYYGTSYVSGDTIADQVTIQAQATGTYSSGATIITDDVVVIVEARGAVMYTCLIAALDNLASTQIVWGFSSGYASPVLHNAVDRVQMEAAFYNRQIISADAKYYASNIPCMTGGFVLLASAIVGAKALHIPIINAPYAVAGDDAYVPLGGANGDSVYAPGCLFIPDGNI